MFNFKKIPISICVVALMFVAFTSCTDRMEGLNQNLKSVSSQDLTIDAAGAKAFLPSIQYHILNTVTWKYQVQVNLNADIYSGYMMTPTPFASNKNNLTYSFVDGWNNRIWITPQVALNGWLKMKRRGFDKKYSDLYGIALICKVFAASIATDAFGPIPYVSYGSSSTPKFNSGKQIYYAFFSDLKTAVQNLSKVETNNPGADQFRFASVDKSQYGGDYAKWIKMANTLRLRLAMRISLVDPGKAQTVAEAAVSQKYGVLEIGDGSFGIVPPGTNPLNTITNSWGNISMGAPLISIMRGYDDPRLPLYAQPATDPAVSSKYKGIRQGVQITSGKTYAGFSKLNVSSSSPIKLLDVAESYFLRAEGTLRGWNMGTPNGGCPYAAGTAGDFYCMGVIASFKEHGLSASAANKYLKNDTGIQVAYVDPKNPANNAPPLNKVTVKWHNGASPQVKLQKIMIQKWIAMYPEGAEAWAEVRRTGYPILYPVKVNYSSAIPNGEFVRRIPYPISMKNTSGKQISAAVSKYLNGSDTGWSRLWWDVKGSGHCPGCLH